MCAFVSERACDFNKIANKLSLNVILNGNCFYFYYETDMGTNFERSRLRYLSICFEYRFSIKSFSGLSI